MNIKALAEQFMAAQDQAFRLGNFGPLEEVESPKVIVHIPPSPDFEGFEAHRQYAINVRESTTGFHREMDFVTGDGNVAVLSYKQKATLKVQPPFSQIPAGSTVIGEGFLVFRRESDRVAEIWVRGSNTVVSVEENRAVVRRVVEQVLDKADPEVIPELFAPDWVYHVSATQEVKGHDAVKQVVTSNHAAFPDMRVIVDELVAEGNRVVCRYTITGTHAGILAGVPPTGKKVSYSGMFVDRMEGGKVVETWGVQDQLSMWRQLGTSPTG